MLVQKSHIVRYHFRDNDGAESTTQVYLAASTPLDVGLSFAGTLRPLIAALSDAPILFYDLIVSWVETNPAPTPSTANIRRTGVFIFQTSNTPPERYVLSVPSLRSELLETAGDYAGVAIRQDEPAVTSLVAALINNAVAPWAYNSSSVSGEAFGGGSWIEGEGGAWSGNNWPSTDLMHDFYQGASAQLDKLLAAYQGLSNERLHISR